MKKHHKTISPKRKRVKIFLPDADLAFVGEGR
jgi:hypothetical protein